MLAPALAQEPTPVLDPAAAGPAQQIWGDQARGDQEVWLRREFRAPRGAKAGRIVFSCDNLCTVDLNGRRVARWGDWSTLTVVDLESLPAGDNVIAVHAKNTGGKAALALWLLWTDPLGQNHHLVTDKTWQYSTSFEAGWNTLEFDFRHWPAAFELGPTPFGRTVHRSVPRGYVYVGNIDAALDDIKRELKKLRETLDAEARLRCLDAIEKAVMQARQQVWEARLFEAASR
jgi:hypothetical protein